MMNNVSEKTQYIIPLAAIKEPPDYAGISYEKDIIEQTFDSDIFKDQAKNNLLRIIPSYIFDSVKDITSLEKYFEYSVGYVDSINLEDHTANITIYDDQYRKFYPNTKIEDLALGMAYDAIVNNHVIQFINVQYFMLIESEGD